MRKADFPRVKYLRNKHSKELVDVFMTGVHAVPESLMKRICQRGGSTAFDYALAFDPTHKAIYMPTIVRWLKTFAIRFEDGRRTRDILARFHEDKHRLPKEQRDIGRYARPGDIAALLDPDENLLSRDMPDHIEAKCVRIADGDGWLLLEIKSAEAAMWWADSTSWCTRHRDTARHYLSVGPLYVLASRLAKYQLSLDQFMDRFDRPVMHAPDLSDDALRAALHLIRGNPSAGVEFFRDGVATVLSTMLKERSGSPTNHVGLINTVSQTGGARWVTDDAAAAVAEDYGITDFFNGRNAGNGGSPNVIVERNGERVLMKSDALQRNGWSTLPAYFDADVEVLVRFLRSGANRADPTLPIQILPTGGEIDMVGRAFVPKGKHGCLVTVEGARYPMWTVDEDGPGRDWAVILFDIDGTSDTRLISVSNRDEFEALPPATKDAVRIYVGDAFSWAPLVLALGPSSVSDKALESWRSFNMLGRVVVAAATHFDRSTIHTKAVMERLFEADVARPMLRALDAIRSHKVGSFAMLHTMSTQDPASADDILRCKHIPGTGLLLAALKDDDCTADLVDALIDTGRTEAIHVMPSRLFSAIRLRRAMERSSMDLAVAHERISTPHVLEVVSSLQVRPRVLQNWIWRCKDAIERQGSKDIHAIVDLDEVARVAKMF